MERIIRIKEEKDSLGGILACAMLSLPATKGFEIGSGFAAARMRGSEHNDAFDIDAHGHVHTVTNFVGGYSRWNFHRLSPFF